MQGCRRGANHLLFRRLARSGMNFTENAKTPKMTKINKNAPFCCKNANLTNGTHFTHIPPPPTPEPTPKSHPPKCSTLNLCLTGIRCECACVPLVELAACEHKCSQPLPPGAGQPVLLILSSLGIRKCVAAPKTKKRKKQQETKKERKTASLWPAEPRNPKPHNGGARPQKSWAQSADRKNAKRIVAGPQRFERKAAPKNKRKKTCSLRGQKNQPCLVWKPDPDFSLTRRKKKKTPLRNRFAIRGEGAHGTPLSLWGFGSGRKAPRSRSSPAFPTAPKPRNPSTNLTAKIAPKDSCPTT